MACLETYQNMPFEMVNFIFKSLSVLAPCYADAIEVSMPVTINIQCYVNRKILFAEGMV